MRLWNPHNARTIELCGMRARLVCEPPFLYTVARGDQKRVVTPVSLPLAIS
jgi:hypothetical protein